MSEVAKEKRNKSKNDPIFLTRAVLDGASFDEATNSVPVVFVTEERALRRDRDGELFYEVLSLDPAHIRSARINSGAPVLDNHDNDGSITKVQLGVVENAVITGAGVTKEYRATLRFSKRKSIEELVEDIRSGIVKNVSAGYRVYQYRDITGPDDKFPALLAIDWEPMEISMVPVPEDYRSGVRCAKYAPKPTIESKRSSENNENVLNKERTDKGMEEKEITPVVEPGKETPGALGDGTRSAVDTGEVSKRAALAERRRGEEIRVLVRGAKLEETFADRLIADETPLDGERGARQLIINEWAKNNGGSAATVIVGANGNAIHAGKDHAHEGHRKALVEALSIRAFGVETLGNAGPETEFGKRAAGGRHVSLMDMGLFELKRRGENVDFMPEYEIFKRSMSTGDFPLTLQNVMNKTLRQRYESAEPVWKKFAKKVSAKDFKPMFSVQFDGDTKPGKLTEKGEYPYVVFKEAGDSFKLDTYGLMTGLSRQMFINDDLGAFTNFSQFFAEGMIENQTNLVYGALLGTDGLGRTLGEDNTKLFNAAKHNNYVSAGTVMGKDSFEAGVVAMRRQKTLGGRKMRGNRPKYLLVPPELETLAYTLINASIVPNTTDNVNPFRGQFEVLVEDYFDDPTSWFFVADPSKVESVKYATLDGQEGISINQWWDEGKDEWKIKARNDFSATIEEFRGIYQNAGA